MIIIIIHSQARTVREAVFSSSVSHRVHSTR